MRVAHVLVVVGLSLLLLAAVDARASDLALVTSDDVRLHVIEAGPRAAPAIVFVPGWTMPAWIFQPQINFLSRRYRVLALDPRGQGESDAPSTGYDYQRRGQDIADLIATLGPRPVLLVGWSLGVLDSLSYVQQFGDARLAGLVLIDNSVGENPAPTPSSLPLRRGPTLTRDEKMRRFVAGMFRTSPGPAYLDRLTKAALRTPVAAAAQLGNYAVPRSYWREALYSVRKPLLYVVRPRFAAQAANVAAKSRLAETVVFQKAGHALFVDEAERFNALLQSFIRRRVWP